MSDDRIWDIRIRLRNTTKADAQALVPLVRNLVAKVASIMSITVENGGRGQ